MTPTQRTLEHYRSDGYKIEVVERWIRTPQGGRRKDLFGFIDLIAIAEGVLIGIQATASGSSARIKKIKTECREDAILWLQAGGKIHVVGWRKLKKPVNRKYWQPKITVIELEDLM
jgi:hypothetical protein